MQEDKNITIKDIITKRKEHSKKVDSKLILKAYDYTINYMMEKNIESIDKDIKYILNVAYILADIGLDDISICAAFLNIIIDEIELSDKDKIKKMFGEEIIEIISGVEKLNSIDFSNIEEKQVENYRKMFLAMGKDIRVIIIKLSDRLYNMRILKDKKRAQQIMIAEETMELYAPLANRLGLYSLKWELEDLSFKYLFPEEYREIVEGIDRKRAERLEFIEKIMNDIRIELKKQRIDADVTRKSKAFI